MDRPSSRPPLLKLQACLSGVLEVIHIAQCPGTTLSMPSWGWEAPAKICEKPHKNLHACTKQVRITSCVMTSRYRAEQE